jgi:acetyl esterase/lipase
MIARQLDVPYSCVDPDVRRIDFFLPDPGAANGAGILFVHGGGWSGGGRASWHAVMEHFAGAGYVCASPGYHLVPHWRYPKQIEDVRVAMAYFRERAPDFGVDPARIAGWGSSAGGHLIALLATIRPEDPLGAAPEVRVRETRPCSVVCLCTVTTLEDYPGYGRLRPTIEAFLGPDAANDPAALAAASPLARVRAGDPPFLFVVGDADPTTPVVAHEQMRDRLTGCGVRSDLVVLPGVGHGFGYGVTTDAQKATIGHAERFLAATTRAP